MYIRSAKKSFVVLIFIYLFNKSLIVFNNVKMNIRNYEYVSVYSERKKEIFNSLMAGIVVRSFKLLTLF